MKKRPAIYIERLDWVYKQPLSVPCKAVLLNLVRRADRNGECFPTVELICTNTSLNRKTAMRSIKVLEACDLIAITRTKTTGKRQGRSGIKNRYQLNYAHTTTPPMVQAAESTTPKRSTRLPDQSTQNGTLETATKAPKTGLCSTTTKVPIIPDQSTHLGTVRETRKKAGRAEPDTTWGKTAKSGETEKGSNFGPESLQDFVANGGRLDD